MENLYPSHIIPESELGHHDEIQFSWDAPAYTQYNKGKAWYMIAGIIILALITFALYKDNYTFAIVLIILSGVYVLQHSYDPHRLHVIISNTGIQIGKNFYQYGNIKTFWMVMEPPAVNTLHFIIADKVNKEVSIAFYAKDAALLRDYLSTQIPEWVGKKETLSDIFIRLFRL